MNTTGCTCTTGTPQVHYASCRRRARSCRRPSPPPRGLWWCAWRPGAWARARASAPPTAASAPPAMRATAWVSARRARAGRLKPRRATTVAATAARAPTGPTLARAPARPAHGAPRRCPTPPRRRGTAPASAVTTAPAAGAACVRWARRVPVVPSDLWRGKAGAAARAPRGGPHSTTAAPRRTAPGAATRSAPRPSPPCQQRGRRLTPRLAPRGSSHSRRRPSSPSPTTRRPWAPRRCSCSSPQRLSQGPSSVGSAQWR
mmetsp:Transcript_9998/g.29424  ORF Transcript_9998/g.29424 Transcript_9998/m.29424 type:complete len:259 (+) Transcript_9998:1234-2010(+)